MHASISMNYMGFLFFLLVLFQVKHFMADYPLQTQYMLGKFKKGSEFILPLTFHCGVHAFFTFMIVMVLDREQRDVLTVAIACAIFDFTIHFIMDRIKASPNYLGRFKALSASEMSKSLQLDPKDVANTRFDNKIFWWCLGLDQMVHHITDYVIIFAILFDKGLWILG
jgi:hypothetical protein